MNRLETISNQFGPNKVAQNDSLSVTDNRTGKLTLQCYKLIFLDYREEIRAQSD